MNYTSDTSSAHNSPSDLDNFRQSLSTDPSLTHTNSHDGNLNDSSQLPNIQDHSQNHDIFPLSSGTWVDTAHNLHQQSSQSDWTHHGDPEINSLANFHHQIQSDWDHSHTPSQINSPDHHWHNADSDFDRAVNHHDHHLNTAPHVVESSRSYSGDGPFIHIARDGDVYLHKLDGDTKVVGHVYGRDFYNNSNEHIGYLGKDGHIYRWIDDSSVGRVESGHIYRENGKEVGRADTDLEGAAHMLFAVRGGSY